MKTINYILLGLLLIAVGISVYMWYNPKIEKIYVQIKPKPEIITIERSDGGYIQSIEKVPTSNHTEVLSKDYITYVNDTLVKALNKGLAYKVEVQNLTKINAMLKDSLSRKNLVINSANKDVIAWKSKYIEIQSNLKDSTVKYTYNAQLDIVDYAKKERLFGEKKQYVAVSSPDKNFKINNVENFTKEIKPIRNLLELNLKLQGLYVDDTLTPYGGAELLFNPDGKFKPIIGYGYFYKENKLAPYFLGGIQYNLIRF